eukprot:GABU01002986.1.p1 GENE.GABU01002986.1~~GABU01002986.1.p1  ORF type:complete len:104 (+),score=5.34 GABU01002986.1:101-412(+)
MNSGGGISQGSSGLSFSKSSGRSGCVSFKNTQPLFLFQSQNRAYLDDRLVPVFGQVFEIMGLLSQDSAWVAQLTSSWLLDVHGFLCLGRSLGLHPGLFLFQTK